MRHLTARLEDGYCSITVANHRLITIIRFVVKSYTHPWKGFANKLHLVLHALKILFSGIVCRSCRSEPNRAWFEASGLFGSAFSFRQQKIYSLHPLQQQLSPGHLFNQFSFRSESCALSPSPIRETVIIISRVVNRHSKNEIRTWAIRSRYGTASILCFFQKKKKSFENSRAIWNLE